MIIPLDKYRKAKAAGDVETYETLRLFGNTVPKMSLAEIQYEARRSAGPRLPANFDGMNSREMLIDAYALATQI
jgi:hypothetical protein